MTFTWVRVILAVVTFVMSWRAMDSRGMTEASFYWYIAGFTLLQLSYIPEKLLERWTLRREVKGYLSLDPTDREARLDRLWLSATRNYLRERLQGQGEVEVEEQIERYPFPVMDSRFSTHLFWASVPVTGAILAAVLGWVSLPLWIQGLLLVLGGTLVGCLILLRRWQQELSTVLEISPQALAMVHPDGSRRTIGFHKALELRNRPRLGRVELREQGSTDYIAIHYDRIGFERALDRILEYGGFPRAAA